MSGACASNYSEAVRQRDPNNRQPDNTVVPKPYHRRDSGPCPKRLAEPNVRAALDRARHQDRQVRSKRGHTRCSTGAG